VSRVPLLAAAVCPHPPVLVPELAAGAAVELDELRAACDTAVARLWACGASRVLVVGADAATREHPPPFGGSFAPWGVRVQVGIGAGLPLSLLMAAWLLSRQPDGKDVAMLGVAQDADPATCRGLGATHDDAEPWALLAMGDGSACRGLKSPGYDDPRAAPYDEGIAKALATADVEALDGLDPDLSAELLVGGRAPWQVLAGAVAATGRPWRGDLTYNEAPYGVAYFVASWAPT
jgi:hypothetical protein